MKYADGVGWRDAFLVIINYDHQYIGIRHDLNEHNVTDWCGFYHDLLNEDIAYTTMDEKMVVLVL
jgi:hypothetical protein